MELNMKETGETVKLVVMEYLITAMETFMKGNLTMTRQTEEVAIIIKMDLNFRVIGKMIINKAMEEKSGKMVHTMKDILTRV
jgi:hypothetical protein